MIWSSLYWIGSKLAASTNGAFWQSDTERLVLFSCFYIDTLISFTSHSLQCSLGSEIELQDLKNKAI